MALPEAANMDLSAFYVQFREETADNVRAIADGLLALERAPGDRAALDAVFRAAHTVKGSARLLGFGAVSALAHAMENLLGAARAGALTLSADLSDLLLHANDQLLQLATAASEGKPVASPDALIARLDRAAAATSESAEATPESPIAAHESVSESPTPAHESPGVATPAMAGAPASATVSVAVTHGATNGADHAGTPAHAASNGGALATSNGAGGRVTRGTVRVRVDRLDRLLAVAGELTVGRQADEDHLRSLQSLGALATRQQRAFQSLAGDLARLRLPLRDQQVVRRRIAELEAWADEIGRLARSTQESFVRHAAAQAALVDDLEAEVFAARLVPVATALASLPRAVRELARSLGKQVELELRGEETEADRKVLDALADPLLHLVRNALDHGLESPAERARAGKPATGRLTIAATAEHGLLQIAVSDDGRGIDPETVRASAVRKSMIDARAAALLSDAEALDLIFMPGFSTSAIITDVSGRGVGMDVVRSRVAELNGHVAVASERGRGTTITLTLPISLMTSQVLLVEAGGQRWAIPAASCRNVIRLGRGAIHRVDGRPMLQLDGRSVALHALADVLGIAQTADDWTDRGHAILLGATRPIAFAVDRLLDEREVVIKPLGALLHAAPLASGVAPLSDGSLAVVLSVTTIIDQARRAKAPPPSALESSAPRRLLIADDSFTTRELLRSILQSAGYEVVTAVDGQDALDRLRADPNVGLVITDVEMPRLDGFGLTRGIRADESLQHLPVVIVTSLHTDEHKRQGLAAGAQAYIVKSQFDQSNLLAAVRDLLGT